MDGKVAHVVAIVKNSKYEGLRLNMCNIPLSPVIEAHQGMIGVDPKV